jgi:hypothetical protein
VVYGNDTDAFIPAGVKAFSLGVQGPKGKEEQRTEAEWLRANRRQGR